MVFFVYRSCLYISSVAINGGGKDEAAISDDNNANGRCTHFFNFIVISILRVRFCFELI